MAVPSDQDIILALGEDLPIGLWVARAPGGEQRVMDRIGPIVDQRLPRYRRYQPAGFVHQKVGCRKIPVMAVRPGESAIERAGDA